MRCGHRKILQCAIMCSCVRDEQWCTDKLISTGSMQPGTMWANQNRSQDAPLWQCPLPPVCGGLQAALQQLPVHLPAGPERWACWLQPALAAAVSSAAWAPAARWAPPGQAAQPGGAPGDHAAEAAAMAGSSCGRHPPGSGAAPCLLSVMRMPDAARACSRGMGVGSDRTNMGRSVAPARCMWH